MKIKNLRSTAIVNLLIAVALTLIVNFSYLLSMMVEQRESSAHSHEQHIQKPEHSGILRLSDDGYGYIICERSLAPEYPDSVVKYKIFVNNRRARWFNLKDGDTIRCTAFPPRGKANRSIDEIISQNGQEPAPIIYDRPSRSEESLMQLLYYFLLSYLLMTIVTSPLGLRRYSTTRNYLLRCALVITLSFVCYFFAPSINWQAGKIMMIFQHPTSSIDWMVILKCTVVLTVAILYGRIYDLISQKQQILLENEHLKSENLQARYNMLVGQINPHFFFNSLNSLSMLIREQDNEKALHYIDQLSYTFRYIIQNGQNTSSTLAEEIEFARAYAELFKVRYADKLFFDIEVDSTYNDYTLPSLTLQPLIGNAVKHNSITRKQPFHISIRTEGATLIVANHKVPKIEPEPSTGIGLHNLRSRWQLITGQDFEIRESDTEFIVRLPLTKPQS